MYREVNYHQEQLIEEAQTTSISVGGQMATVVHQRPIRDIVVFAVAARRHLSDSSPHTHANPKLAVAGGQGGEELGEQSLERRVWRGAW
jgi:hypothetical protein